MRRGVLLAMAAIGVSLAFGLSNLSAQKAGTPHPRPTRASVPVTADPYIGPGVGGIGSIRGTTPPARFLGVTSRTFPVGVGALAASRACNEEHPASRLCEWADIFRQVPPTELPGEVLVAPNYETNPLTSCLNPNGAPRCAPLPVMKPAACCGYPIAGPGPIASLTLMPGEATILDCSDNFDFTVLAQDVEGRPVEGVLVIFIVPPVVGGTMIQFTPASGLTGSDGTLATTVTLAFPLCVERCEDPSTSCDGMAIQARDGSGAVFSNEAYFIDGI